MWFIGMIVGGMAEAMFGRIMSFHRLNSKIIAHGSKLYLAFYL